MNNSRAAKALMTFVRGGTEAYLREAGIEVTFQEDGSIRVDIPASVPGVTPSERDIVLGFARATAEGHLRVWASLMLATSNIELDAIADNPHEEILLNALWDASAGRALSESARRRLQEAASNPN